MRERKIISWELGNEVTLDQLPGQLIDIHTPDVAAAHLVRVAELREESRRAQAAAAAELRKAARELKNSGMPLRDIGQLLDVSYQRAHQLVS